MGRPKGFASLAGGAVALALLATAAPARAQETGRRFGDRDETIVSVERMLGFQNQQLDEDGGSIDATGFQPFLWGSLGIFGMGSSGLSFGVLLGFSRLEDEDGDGISVGQLRPRIGYGGTEREGRFGFWVRGGPSLVYLHSESNDGYAFAAGGEAYAVVFPAPHVGVLLGPHAEFHLAGGGDGDPYYKSVGLTVGLMGEFH